MPLNITTNSAAASASYYLGKNQSALQKSLNRLASGKKIIAPYDDPGSLSVSMKLQASINRLGGAQNNVKNGISFLEVQDGILAFAGRIVDRMAELKGLSSQDPMKSSLDQASYNDEFKDLQVQLYQMSQQTFNGVSLFASYTTDADGQPTSTEAMFRGGVSRDNTLTLYTSSDGSAGSQVSVHKATFLSALTIDSASSQCICFWQQHKIQFVKHIGNSIQFCSRKLGLKFHSGFSLGGRFLESTGEHRLSSCTKRRNHVQTHLLGRDDLTDEDKYAGSTRSDCGCGYRRGEHRARQKPCTRTGIGSYARSGQFHQRYRPHAPAINYTPFQIIKNQIKNPLSPCNL